MLIELQRNNKQDFDKEERERKYHELNIIACAKITTNKTTLCLQNLPKLFCW